jgi:hypothetical protein
MKWAAKLVHHAKYMYNINKTMHQEIDLFRKKLQPSPGITWEMSIAHIIPRTPMATAIGDSFWKVQEDTQLVWVTGGICLFQKK